MTCLSYVLVFSAFYILICLGEDVEKIDDKDLKPPELVGEELDDHNINVPKHMRCDACIASIAHIFKAFDSAEVNKRKKGANNIITKENVR